MRKFFELLSVSDNHMYLCLPVIFVGVRILVWIVRIGTKEHSGMGFDLRKMLGISRLGLTDCDHCHRAKLWALHGFYLLTHFLCPRVLRSLVGIRSLRLVVAGMRVMAPFL